MAYRHWDESATKQLDKAYRRDLVNRISGARTAWLLGSWSDKTGNNLGLFSNVVHVGANPPLLGLIFRPETVKRDSLENIRENNEFSLNAVQPEMMEMAHQASAKYAADTDEFEAIGFEIERKNDSRIPFVSSALLQLQMQMEELHPIKANGCLFMISRIVGLHIHESALDEDDLPDCAQWLHVCGLDQYVQSTPLKKLPYARP